MDLKKWILDVKLLTFPLKKEETIPKSLWKVSWTLTRAIHKNGWGLVVWLCWSWAPAQRGVPPLLASVTPYTCPPQLPRLQRSCPPNNDKAGGSSPGAAPFKQAQTGSLNSLDAGHRAPEGLSPPPANPPLLPCYCLSWLVCEGGNQSNSCKRGGERSALRTPATSGRDHRQSSSSFCSHLSTEDHVAGRHHHPEHIPWSPSCHVPITQNSMCSPDRKSIRFTIPISAPAQTTTVLHPTSRCGPDSGRHALWAAWSSPVVWKVQWAFVNASKQVTLTTQFHGVSQLAGLNHCSPNLVTSQLLLIFLTKCSSSLPSKKLFISTCILTRAIPEALVLLSIKGL